jgi:hypothetical protein
MSTIHSVSQHSNRRLKDVFPPIGVLPGSDCQLEQTEEGRTGKLAAREAATARQGRVEASVVWLILGLLFAILVFGYPLLLATEGNSLGLRYLVRLGSSLLLVVFFALSAAAVYFATNRFAPKR